MIFLNYASEDLLVVEDIYSGLKDRGLCPWMAAKDISPGELWERKIYQAVDRADFVIVCISKHSVNKRGFVQSEIRRFIELWQQKLPDDIYLIPVRLDETPVPQDLARFQWLNWDGGRGWENLIRAISRVQESKPTRSASNDAGATRTEKLEEHYAGPPRVTISVQYPQFAYPDAGSDLDEINARVKGLVLQHVHEVRKSSTEVQRSSKAQELQELMSGDPTYAYDLDSSYTVSLFSSSLISLFMRFSSYSAGAAHGMHWTTSVNFGLKPVVEYSLRDLFGYDDQYLDSISRFCIGSLTKQAQDEGYDYSDWIKEGAAAEVDNYQTFSLVQDGLLITFQEYQVGPYAWGIRNVQIPVGFLSQHADPRSWIFRLLSQKI